MMTNFTSTYEVDDYGDSDWGSDTSSVLDKDDAFDVVKGTAEELFTKRIEHDRMEYKHMKEVWCLDTDNRRMKG